MSDAFNHWAEQIFTEIPWSKPPHIVPMLPDGHDQMCLPPGGNGWLHIELGRFWFRFDSADCRFVVTEVDREVPSC